MKLRKLYKGFGTQLQHLRVEKNAMVEFVAMLRGDLRNASQSSLSTQSQTAGSLGARTVANRPRRAAILPAPAQFR
jgi:hypothetical protein